MKATHHVLLKTGPIHQVTSNTVVPQTPDIDKTVCRKHIKLGRKIKNLPTMTAVRELTARYFDSLMGYHLVVDMKRLNA
jgi:hypothetical protein